MKRFAPAMVAVSAAVAACTAGGGAGSAVSGVVSRGKAIEVPGLAALNNGGGAKVLAVSCASAGNCAAAGHYTDGRHHQRGFVADERHGRWGPAIAVSGLAALSGAYSADVVSVSCGSAGNCAAGGNYTQLPNIVVPIIVTERGGRWGKAVALPGDSQPGDGEVNSISCTFTGNCLAGGGIAGNNEYFYVGDGFVVQQQAGRWGPVRLVPGLRALEHGSDPQIVGSYIDSVACPSAGNCAAGGDYTNRCMCNHAFVAAERNGVWGTAIDVPGLAALNTGGNAQVLSVSCALAGSCAAGGYYASRDHSIQGFVVVERNGVWGTATEVPGLAALNTGGNAQVLSVSCALAGSCAAGGYYTGGSRHRQGFVAVERNGVWRAATVVPGLAALNKGGGSAQVLTVSCAPAGSCAAGGYYTDGSRHRQGFVAVERNGVWRTAIEVPGLGALNAGGSAEVSSISCSLPGSCAIGGFYTDRSGHHQGFVI